jgi:flagella basal body P-ring formation protein FlgA
MRIILFTLFLLINTVFGANIEIYLKEVVYLPKYDVFLSDIANIKTKNKNLKTYLSSLVVKRIYDREVITKEEIINLLKKNFLDISQTKIYGEKTIVVLEKSTIDKEFLKEYIKKYIAKKYPNIEIEDISIRNINIQVLGKPNIKIKEKGKTNSYIYLSLKIPNLSRSREISASVRYSKIVKAVVANYPLPKGHIIKPEDIRVSYIKLKRKRDYIDNVKLVIGKSLKRNINKNQPISFKDLKKEYLVRKNSNIRVIYKKGNFKIEILGRALENGEKGQIIKVKNISSGKVIQCKVIGANKVEFLSGQY